MKFASKQDRDFLLRKALFLRYGKEIKDLKKDELNQTILPTSPMSEIWGLGGLSDGLKNPKVYIPSLLNLGSWNF